MILIAKSRHCPGMRHQGYRTHALPRFTPCSWAAVRHSSGGVGIDVAPVHAKRLGLRLSFCRFYLEGFQRPTVLITPYLLALACIAYQIPLAETRGGGTIL